MIMYYIIIFCNFQNLKTVNDFCFCNHQLHPPHTKSIPIFQLLAGKWGIYFSHHPLSNAVIPGCSLYE